MRPPVDDSATATVSPLSLRRAPTELARVWRGDGIRFCFGRPDLIGTWSRVFRLALAFG